MSGWRSFVRLEKICQVGEDMSGWIRYVRFPVGSVFVFSCTRDLLAAHSNLCLLVIRSIVKSNYYHRHVCLSVRLYVRREQLGFRWTYISKI